MPLNVSAQVYGSAAQAALHDAVSRAKSADGNYDPLSPVTIVVPSSLAGYHVRRTLGRQPGGVVNVQVKPLQALLELIGAASLANDGRRPLPEAYRSEAIRAVAEASGSIFGDVPIDGPVLQTLEAAFDEFDRCDEAQLGEIAAGNSNAAYLVARYRAYQERTSKFYTTRDLAESATKALATQPSVLRDIGAVIVYLPGELTSAQHEFLATLSEHAIVEVILGLTGDAEAVDEHTLQSWSQHVDLQNGLLSGENEPIPTAQRIVQAPDPEEEVRSAIRAISTALHSDPPTPLHRTAILYRQANPYARICAEQLDAAGVPWNGVNAQTLKQSIAGRTLDGLLGLMASSTLSWAVDVAPWLAAAPMLDSNRELAPTARWNQLARRANLHRGSDRWDERLRLHLSTRADDLRRLSRVPDDDKPGRLPWVRAEVQQVKDLMAFTSQLTGFIGETPERALWSEHAQRLRQQMNVLLGDRTGFARSTNTGEDDLQLARWDDVYALLNSLEWLDELGQATPEQFASAVRRRLERPTGHHGRVGDGVFVGSLRSAVGMEWDSVFIVGAAERSLPQTRSDDPLLPDELRRRASLPTSSDHLRRERSDYLIALHAADQRVLSYPRADVRAQQARLPGRWLLESATALNDGERVYASKIDQASSEVVQATPSFESAVMRAGMSADIHEFDLQRIKVSPHASDHYLAKECPPLKRGFVQRRERRTRQMTRWDGLIADGAARETTRPHSAGALQDWATCPYRYFLGRVLRIEERDEPRDDLQITPLDKGSLIHDILDQFFKATTDQPEPGGRWSDAVRERLETIAETALDHAHEQGLTGRDLLWRRDKQRILDDLQTLLEQDDTHRAKFNATQIASELVFGALEESQGLVRFELNDGSVLELRGMIDRIDRSEDGQQLIVIDYKTGGEFPKGSELKKDAIVGGRFLQLPIYAHAARQLYGLDDAAPVQSAYWYITQRGEFKYNPVEWDEANSKRFEEAINLIADNVRSGYFPANPGGDHHRSLAENCAYCSFDAVCPADRRAHWQQIKLDPRLTDYVQLTEGPAEEEAEA